MKEGASEPPNRSTTHPDAAKRLSFFVERGRLSAIPSDWQLRVGWMAMLPITLSESERERERSRSTWLGQIPIRVPLQLLYSPHQGSADTGLLQPASRIVRHLLSVYHEDAFLGYDLELLQSHENGLALLAKRAREVAEGRDLVSRGLRALVGWPGYHEGLVALAERAGRFEYPDTLDLDPRFVSLVGFAEFCLSLPDWPPRSFYGFDLAKLRPHDDAKRPP
jgi:hypothetical protein